MFWKSQESSMKLFVSHKASEKNVMAICIFGLFLILEKSVPLICTFDSLITRIRVKPTLLYERVKFTLSNFVKFSL